MPETTTEKTEVKQIEDANMLVGVLASKLRATLTDDGPLVASVLEWLATQKPAVCRLAIIGTQPKGWAIAAAPLIESLSDDQCAGVLACLMAVWVQAL